MGNNINCIINMVNRDLSRLGHTASGRTIDIPISSTTITRTSNNNDDSNTIISIIVTTTITNIRPT